MQWFHYAIAGIFILALLVSHKTPRAWIWLCAMATTYVGSIAYLRYYETMEAANTLVSEWPALSFFAVPLETSWLPPSAIAAFLDLALAFLLHRFGKERWETFYLFHGVLLMALANLLFFTGTVLGFPPLPTQRVLGITLEAINIGLFFTIFGTGLTDLLGAANGYRGARGLMGWLLESRRLLRQPYKRKLWEK